MANKNTRFGHPLRHLHQSIPPHRNGVLLRVLPPVLLLQRRLLCKEVVDLVRRRLKAIDGKPSCVLELDLRYTH